MTLATGGELTWRGNRVRLQGTAPPPVLSRPCMRAAPLALRHWPHWAKSRHNVFPPTAAWTVLCPTLRQWLLAGTCQQSDSYSICNRNVSSSKHIATLLIQLQQNYSPVITEISTVLTHRSTEWLLNVRDNIKSSYLCVTEMVKTIVSKRNLISDAARWPKMSSANQNLLIPPNYTRKQLT